VRFLLLWVVLMAGLLTLGAGAEPPTLVAYQGVLLDPNGSPRNGPVNLELRIFDAATSGNELYRETHSGVALVDGVFNIDLGSGTQQQPPGGFTAELFAGPGARWLELRVGGELLQPRQRFLSVPYALSAAGAAQVGGLTPAELSATPGPVSGYERVSAASTSAQTAVASCPPGKVLVGGGCNCNGETVESRPVEGSNFWRCECAAPTGNHRAYALCAEAGVSVCGDGVLDSGEQCDSSLIAACPDGRCGDGCVCACGNGLLDPDEVCEGANASGCPGGLCAPDCTCSCGNGSIDPGELCDGAIAGACPTGVCTSSCTCQCGNGVCDDIFSGGGTETTANCPQDCKPPYSTCVSNAECAGLAFCGGSGYCTTTCTGGTACSLDPGFDEFCAALPGFSGICVAQCKSHPIFPGVWFCPADLVCESINGGNCIAP
jgi:hypothetical protein